jgi:polysaccharide biosynthesis protein PslG
VPLSIWYDWKNDGPDPNENEHNFGTVYQDLSPKPAYVAIQTLTRELSGYRIARGIPMASDKDYVLLCRGPSGASKVAAWTVAEPHQVELQLSLLGRNRVQGMTSKGDRFTPTVKSGHLVLDLGSAPQYVTLRGASLK